MEYRDLEQLVALSDDRQLRPCRTNYPHLHLDDQSSCGSKTNLGALFQRGHSGVRLTPGGRAAMLHVQRVLGELDALKCSGTVSGAGDVGEIGLGVRLPRTVTAREPAGRRRARNPKIILSPWPK